jgi:adenylate cyclase
VAKVFLSYAREDLETARQLAECVGRAGHEVWWDRHIQGGSRYTNEIDRALKDSEAVVVLWSETSVESAWVQDEAAEGRDTGRLVPVTLNASRPPLGFRQFHAIDLGTWNGAGDPANLDELVDAIGKTAGPSSAPASPKAQAREHKASVCVLPFVNMSGDPEQEYFSDGITEDIITDLSKVSALSVVARNTAFTFKGKSVDLKEVARSLGVSHVLEGSVRKAGERVRITAQLIDGAAGDHVWADRFDRELTDIFAIQDEISKAIVAALQLKLLPEEKKAIENRGTTSVDAYNLYLMARQHWIGGKYGDVRRDEVIVRMCRQAVSLDPNYAEAWALMALAQAEARFWHGQTSENALPAAERALSINPNLAEPRCVKAHYFEEEGRLEDADRELNEALRLNPDSWEVNREAGRMMYRQDRGAEAIPFFAKAMELMNRDFHSGSMLISCYLDSGDQHALMQVVKQTLQRCEAAIAEDPSNVAALAAGASCLVIFGEEQRAKEWSQRALLLDPDNVSMLYNLGCALTFKSENLDGALNILEQFFEKVQSATIIRHSEADPDLDVVRDHPRYTRMLAGAMERLGIPPSA